MIADMIDTPESERNEPLPLDVTYFSTFNFDDHDHMICHQEKTNGNDLFNKKSIMHSIREAKTMKISNTSRTSHSISEAKTMKINNSSHQSREGASMNPTKLFSPSMMKVKKVINWQDKIPISRRSIKIGVLFQKKAKRVGGKRPCPLPALLLRTPSAVSRGRVTVGATKRRSATTFARLGTLTKRDSPISCLLPLMPLPCARPRAVTKYSVASQPVRAELYLPPEAMSSRTTTPTRSRSLRVTRSV